MGNRSIATHAIDGLAIKSGRSVANQADLRQVDQDLVISGALCCHFLPLKLEWKQAYIPLLGTLVLPEEMDGHLKLIPSE